MTIAEKLAEIAENQIKIYEAGQKSAPSVDESKLIKKTVTGKYIFADDVSEVPHEAQIQLTSDTITDFSGITVSVYGANLLDVENRSIVDFGAAANTTRRTFTGNGIIVGFAYNNYYNKSGVTSFEKTKNGFVFSNRTNNTPYGIGFDFKAAANRNYVAGYEGIEGVTGSAIFLTEYDKDGNFLRYNMPKNIADGRAKRFKTGDNTAWVVVSIQNKIAETAVEFNNVYVGMDTVTEFEECNEVITYPANADGTVSGVKARSHYMTLLASEDVDITMVYNKSFGMQTEYDRFWDLYQNKGGIVDGAYMFAGTRWNDNIYRPKYPVRVSKCTGLFRLSNLTDTKVTIDFSCLEENGIQVFNGASQLNTIPKIVVKEDVTYVNWFDSCTALEEIRFEGVIGQSIDLHWSKNLSAESYESIFGCLSRTSTGKTVTVSTTAEGIYDAKYGTGAWAQRIAECSGWTFKFA